MGIYTTIEDKWYDVLEKINKFIPILKVTDKIDEYFPSFILFLVLFLLIAVVLLWVIFSGITPVYEVEVLVLTKQGNALSGARLVVEDGCEENSRQFVADSNGKIYFETCTDMFQVKATKDGYLQATQNIDLQEGKQHTIKLDAKPIETKPFNVKVINSSSEILPNATIELYCVNYNDTNKTRIDANKPNTSQPTNGFDFNLPSKCTMIQIKAKASGYDDQTVTVQSNENSKTITMQKTVLQGTIIFIANSPIGRQANASIVLTNSLGQTQNIYTSTDGSVTKLLNEDTYSYTAVVKGAIANGTFVVVANQTKDQNVYFSTLTSEPNLDTTKNIYIKLVDGNNVFSTATATVFFTQGNDTNLLMPLSASLQGVFGPTQIVDFNNKTFSAVIKMAPYQTKIVDVNLRTVAQGPQIVQMTQGGVTLNVKVIDDLNKPIEDVSTQLYLGNFKGYFDVGLPTDKNGNTSYRNLPSGSYTLTGKTDELEGTLSVQIGSANKDVNLKIVTGTGTMTYTFYENASKINPLIEVYEKLPSGDFNKIDSAYAKSGSYTTKSLKAGAEIKVIVNDGNYISYESMVYTIKRGSQSKTIYLRKVGTLPNQNEAQMILRQVYDSNPITGYESVSDKIMPGGDYYFLFEAIINTTQSGRSIANFFVSPEDKNYLVGNEAFSISAGYSTEDSTIVLSAVKKSFEIEQSTSNADIVDTNAKQLNSVLTNETGLKMIPIIVKIKVDANATGKARIYYQEKFIDYYSLYQYKEFTIGDSFCIGSDCPAFLFSNYLKWNNGNYLPLDDTVHVLLLNDTYKLKTIVENTTDQNIWDSNIVLSVSSGADKLLFGGDLNITKAKIRLLPLYKTDYNTFDLITKKAASTSIDVIEKVEKLVNGSDTLSSYKDNGDKELWFEVRNRDDLNMYIYATATKNQIYANNFYNDFYLKVYAKDGMSGTTKKVKAFWTAKLVENNYSLGSGWTDQNGEATIQLDLSNVSAGKKVLFEATDANNSTPARLEITLIEAITPPATAPVECVKVKLNGTDVLLSDNPTITINTTATGQFTIDSNCDTNKQITITTDLYSNYTLFTLNAHSSTTVTLDGSQTVIMNDNTTGIYPVTVKAAGNGATTEVGAFDVILIDPTNPFTLDDYIYDFRTAEIVSSKVVNTAYAGRIDNFYPKMDVSTNSVVLGYHKPGVPSTYTVNAKVVGSAIESIVYGYTWAVRASQSGQNCQSDIAETPSEFYFISDAETTCEEMVSEISEWEVEAKPEPSASTAPEIKKINKISFEETNTDPTGNPSAPVTGDIYQTYPPGQIASGTESTDCHIVSHSMPWVAAPRPPGWIGSENWQGGGEKPSGKMKVVSISGCTTAYVSGVIDGAEAGSQFLLYGDGEDSSTWSSGSTCYFKTQPEFSRVLNFEQEQTELWEQEFTFEPIEGRDYTLGPYGGTPAPQWETEEKIFDHSPGDTFADGETLMGIICVEPMGFIPPEKASGEESYELPDQNDPYIEYDASGLISYKLIDVPSDLSMYLRDGQVHAQYIGSAEVAGRNIDFNLTKVSISGDEYATITVSDWINASTTVQKKFQVKLVGAPSNCYTADGIAGLTGSAYVPRLLFDWTWDNIGMNQCDASNNDYTYCDATQFMVTLFKKLDTINDLKQQGDMDELSRNTAFYSYLIKDNYTQDFLNDFDTFYSSKSFSSINFNTAGNSRGYDQFITGNRIKFKVKDSTGVLRDGGQLDKGGVYNVWVDMDYDNPNVPSLFDNNSPNATITVTFNYVMDAPNYNPFYETPFDGEVGKSGNTYVRKNYGVALNTGELILNNQNEKAGVYTNPFVQLNYQTGTDLNILNQGTIIEYDLASKTLKFYPAQPTPVQMTITGSGNSVYADYVMDGFDAATGMSKKWNAKYTTMSTTNCMDFSGQSKYFYYDQALGNGNRRISWPTATKSGTLGLTTVFYTPKTSTIAEVPTITPLDPTKVRFYTSQSVPSITSSTTIILKYFDDSGLSNYNNIQGVFDMIDQEKLCFSQDSSEKMTIWWNPEYLSDILNEIGVSTGHSCQ